MNTTYDDLRPAASNMLRANMGVNEGERILFLTDVPVPQDWSLPYQQLEAMLQRALMTKRISEMMSEEFPHCTLDFLSFPATGQSGKEPPEPVAERLLSYDVVIMMTTFSLSHTNARQQATDKGVRIASMPGIESRMFAPNGPMMADYEAVSRDSQEWAEKLTQGNEVHVTTPFGTDLRFSIKGRTGFADDGLYQKKGSWGNLPAGEAYTTPVEGTAQGKLVVPKGWYPDLASDMTLTFEKGYVTSITGGGEVGKRFEKLLDFGNTALNHRRNCAELGIGTNPYASRTDNILEAEKIKGTIHIAIGDNVHMGGLTESDLHADFVLTAPVLHIDGQRLIG